MSMPHDEQNGILEAAAAEIEAIKGARTVKAKRGAARPIVAIPTHVLLAELERRDQSRHRLEAQRDALARQLADVERQLAELGPPPPGGYVPRQEVAQPTPTRQVGRRGPRPRNDVSLADAIALAVEVGAIATPREAAEQIRKDDYRTTSKAFSMAVSNALPRDERVGRDASRRPPNAARYPYSSSSGRKPAISSSLQSALRVIWASVSIVQRMAPPSTIVYTVDR